MLIFQVVGYKNSGKTTYISEWISYFTEKGLNVATLKHHGHGGIPKFVENTDTAKHAQAGAVMTGVEGDGSFQLSIKQQSWNMDQLLAFYRMMDIDLLILEGFKEYDFPKIVLIRDELDLPLLNRVTNVEAVITTIQLDKTDDHCPIFKPTDTEKIKEWLAEHLLSQ
ncbi:molybdopterin-guanine dinucleotide biosynthesis protein B [Salirhabdus salicampi]|uniref:molybdopterin-guanine dinucleotide biosynthesis protein B n=1 Tax=Salirhabdus salicampi TaxID=476102 RepID=UPI0020C24A16|nr:molybdopterin-guanine dinucleotide biosynthesis protein B [Salirhabdus salicampi]MCP8615648.1 molybdopterin-guanine dinucleotide biosynthesis protein B [Salirhabdus salicampi]